MDRPDRSVLWIGGAVLAVVIVAVVVIVGLGTSDPETFAPDSPEYALQQYLAALHAGDEDRAIAYLSDDARRQFASNNGGREPYCQGFEGRQIKVRETTYTGNRATVTLEIQEFSGSGLDFVRYSWIYPILMVNESGWKVDDPYVCV